MIESIGLVFPQVVAHFFVFVLRLIYNDIFKMNNSISYTSFEVLYTCASVYIIVFLVKDVFMFV